MGSVKSLVKKHKKATPPLPTVPPKADVEDGAEDAGHVDDLAGMKVDDLSDFAPPTEEEIAAAVASLKSPQRGAQRDLKDLPRVVRDTMTRDEIRAGRSRRTTLYQLMVTLDEVAATRHPEKQLPLVKKVGRLAEHYRLKHARSKDPVVRGRLDLMVEIDRLASAHILRTYAQMQYAERVNGTGLNPRERKEQLAKQPKGRPQRQVQQFQYLSEASDIRSYDPRWSAPTDEIAFSDPTASDPQKAPNAQLAATTAGLSAGELLAIRTYTADNYRYMNPQMTDFEPGLTKHLENNSKVATEERVERIRQEGATHAGMAVSGLAKLPGWKGITYRGDNVDLARMQKLYTVGKAATNQLFLSTSKQPGTGRQFLRESDGPIKLFLEVECAGNGSKDISSLSTKLTEKEVLIVPGAKYVTLSIEEYDVKTYARTPLSKRPDGKRGPDGSAPAYYVRIRQVG